jgi:hypothetical protein
MDDWNLIYKTAGGYGGAGSGTGSQLHSNLTLIHWLYKFISYNKITSIIDVPCGDMQWIPTLLNMTGKVFYLGIDYIDYLVENNKKTFPQFKFECKDLFDRNFCINEHFDLLICKDILQHCSKDERMILWESLDNIPAKYKLIITPFNCLCDRGVFLHSYLSDYEKLIYKL